MTIAAVALLVAIAASVTFLLRRGGPSAPPSKARVSTGGPASSVAESNEYFEKAMFFMTSQMDLARARQMLERALAIDPEVRGGARLVRLGVRLMLDVGQYNGRDPAVQGRGRSPACAEG